jgi:ATP:ADP antiporter, AAA family
MTPRAGLLQRLVLVRTGEWPALLWSAGYFFFLLSGYYILRPVRETLGIDRGADKLPWLMTGTMLAMLLVNPLFAAMVSRFPRRVFIPWTYRFFALNLLGFVALAAVFPDTPAVGYAFYIWVSVFNLFAVSIFWAVMADGFSPEQSKRLFGVIGVGGTLGAIVGGSVTATLVNKVGPFGLLLISAVLLEAAVQCARQVLRTFAGHRQAARHGQCPVCGSELSDLPPREQARKCPKCATSVPLVREVPAEPGPGMWTGLQAILRSRYLLLICLYLFLYTTLSTFLYLQQGRIVESVIPDRAGRTALFAQIDIAVNILTILTQVFLTGRIIRWIGVGASLAILPTVSIIGFAALWAAPALGMPLLGIFVVFQVARRGLHYAISRPSREILFTVLSQDAKYKSKPFIDTFVYRGGDLFGAWSPTAIIALASRRGIGALAAIPMAAIPLAAISLVVAIVLGKMHHRRQRGS